MIYNYNIIITLSTHIYLSKISSGYMYFALRFRTYIYVNIYL
ncbi:hypothetical protein [Klebsiella phage vB_KpnS-VAC2]|uniref:Uncharacterized protein n=1 Tax=Klebsiella phage vB_KpnS-VAC2 TaxID=2864369 RepID=A0AAE7XHA5_9CAUD|nr:hypothetical protein [Klebsiella phage vB_KpnS-VAC2]